MPGGTGRIAVPIHVMDLLPTFIEAAGADYPDRYLGAEVAPLQGHSLDVKATTPDFRGEVRYKFDGPSLSATVFF